MNNRKKKVSKKKLIIIVSIVVAAAIALGVYLFFLLKPNDKNMIPVIEVQTGDITENLETSCTVVSSKQGMFEIFDGVYVKDVNVRVGDEVKKGDVLATFDTSSLNSLIAQKSKTYKEARNAYLKYENTSNEATGELEKISDRISYLEKCIVELEKKVEINSNKVPNTPQILNLKEKLTDILGDNSLAAKIVDGLISSSSSVEKTIKLLEDIINGVNVKISNITVLMNGSEDAKALASAQIEMIELKIRKGALSIQSQLTLENMYYSVMESSKRDLDETKAAIQKLSSGWKAENDGIIREVNIQAGEKYKAPKVSFPNIDKIDITSVLSSLTSSTPDFSGIIRQLFPERPNGMIVEYYPLEATFTIGKSDYFKISLGQNVKVTSASEKEFDGYISYINPVAKEGGININSVLGAGTSGSIMEGKVTIKDPDKSVIIGLDMDLKIQLETQENVVIVPVESIQNTEDGTYVYVYNKNDRKIKKTSVKTGLFNGMYYQIISGCKEGDLIVKLPTQKLEDGQKIYAKFVK